MTATAAGVSKAPRTLDCVPLLSGAPLDDESAARLASLLRVLADPGRLRILSLIQAQPGNEACVCHLTDALDVLQPTVSHHLRVLFEAGLVERERRGNWVYYRTIPSALESIREALGAGIPSGEIPLIASTVNALGSGSCSADCRCS